MRRSFFRRKKVCPFSGQDAPKIDYKDIKLLQKLSAVSARRQRELSLAIKRARFLALLPYSVR